MHLLGTGGIARFQHLHVVSLGQQGAASGQDNGVIINDQDFHGSTRFSFDHGTI